MKRPETRRRLNKKKMYRARNKKRKSSGVGKKIQRIQGKRKRKDLKIIGKTVKNKEDEEGPT